MAITVQNSSFTVPAAAASSSTTNLRVGGIAERYLIHVTAMRSNTASVTSAVWQPAATPAGQTMTLLGAFSHPTQPLRIEIHGLLAPTRFSSPGSRVSLTYSASVNVVGWAICLEGVDQTTPYTGYPGAATDFQTANGTFNSGAPNTSSLSLTTAAGDMVVMAQATDLITELENFIAGTGQEHWNNLPSATAPASAKVRLGGSTKVATGSPTTVFGTVGNAATPLFYILGGIAFKKSTDNSPYYVLPPHTALANTASATVTLPQATLTAISTTGFPAGAATPRISIGYPKTAAWAVVATPTYTGLTATTLTGGAEGSSVITNGERIEPNGFGNLIAVATTLGVVIPSNALVDDIAIVSFYTLANASAPTSAGAFTIITSQVVGAGLRHDTYYRRIIGGDAGTTITFTLAASNFRAATISLYRGCITTGSPVESSATTSVTTNVSFTTAATVTPVANNTTVLSYFATATANAQSRPTTNSDLSLRIQTLNIACCDTRWLVGGTNPPARSWSNSSTTTWATASIVLLPAIGGATLARSAARAGTVSTSPLSRATSTYRRSGSRAGTVAPILTRRGSIYHKAPTRTGTILAVLDRTLTYARHPLRTGTINAALFRRTSIYNRLGIRTGSISAAVRLPGIRRTALRIGTIAAALTRPGSIYHKALTRTGTVAPVLRRRTSIYRRSGARTGTIAPVVLRRTSIYRRGVPYTRGAGFSFTVVRSVSGGAVSFGAYGTEPILRIYASAKYPTATFYFEATLRCSAGPSNIAYARLYDITAGSFVSGSQVSVTGTTGTRARSGAISLVDGHTYRAEVGRTSGYSAIISNADLIIESAT